MEYKKCPYLSGDPLRVLLPQPPSDLHVGGEVAEWRVLCGEDEVSLSPEHGVVAQHGEAVAVGGEEGGVAVLAEELLGAHRLGVDGLRATWSVNAARAQSN